MLKQYMFCPSHVLNYEHLEIRGDLTYEEKLEKMINKKIQELRTRKIPLVKILWKNHEIEERSWELEDEMRSMYCQLFQEGISK